MELKLMITPPFPTPPRCWLKYITKIMDFIHKMTIINVHKSWIKIEIQSIINEATNVYS